MQLVYNSITSEEYTQSQSKSQLYYGIHRTIFGKCLIAVNNQVIYYLAFLNNYEEAIVMKDLQKEWYLSDLHEDVLQTQAIIDLVLLPSAANKKLSIFMKGTDFQLKVWRTLLTIPAGTIVTYQEVARQIQHIKAVRAVANAVGTNHISYLVPCHRVLRKSGAIGGYKWGIEIKKAMIEFEKVDT